MTAEKGHFRVNCKKSIIQSFCLFLGLNFWEFALCSTVTKLHAEETPPKKVYFKKAKTRNRS